MDNHALLQVGAGTRPHRAVHRCAQGRWRSPHRVVVFPRSVDNVRNHPQRYPLVPCLIRLMRSLTCSNTTRFSAIWPRIFSHACMTVV